MAPRLQTQGNCCRCGHTPSQPQPLTDYSYLLGLYLGDGSLGHVKPSVWSLCITCADAWPGLIAECKRAMQAIRPANRVNVVQRDGCVVVLTYSKHWPCFFPQHGPGMKHTRRIALEPWQQEIVDEHAGPFLRGLFHSDGCRVSNRVTRYFAGRTRHYQYPRYFFTNRSGDILELCGQTLEGLGIAWRYSRPHVISVARRDAVAALDEFVGPKY